LYGYPMRVAILCSITLSQLGFTSAYLIFVAQNLQAFVLAVSKCATSVSTLHLILAQLVVLLPLAMVRNLTKLSTTALVADAFILVGLVYIFSNEFAVIANEGIAEVRLFNPRDYALLIGFVPFLLRLWILSLSTGLQHGSVQLRGDWSSEWSSFLSTRPLLDKLWCTGHPHHGFDAGTAQVSASLDWCHVLFDRLFP
jgi:hypothetical protein